MVDNENEKLDQAFPGQDIVFDCVACGKSLVINALGAGLAITCPDCGAEQQVPAPGGAEPAIPETEQEAVAEDAGGPARNGFRQLPDAGGQEAGHELPEISEVLADARQQINALKSENEELQVRRKFLEKRHATLSHSLQALRQELAAIRQALDGAETVLDAIEGPSAGDTQPIA